MSRGFIFKKSRRRVPFAPKKDDENMNRAKKKPLIAWRQRIFGRIGAVPKGIVACPGGVVKADASAASLIPAKKGR